jgi:hypothetical protein
MFIKINFIFWLNDKIETKDHWVILIIIIVKF